ncbi:redoxin domain-containing protein [Thiobacillus sp.]|uniref:redoxin domain-containing protein n=1 Tax=Thiobacillus sp. TaxID=924 RepID=UPI0011D4B5F4|nr:redoxin domain-containing protein [Thiobacillus sp.]TXH73968.1 MAG: redoxin domain-containing protein [Thiobacillus sp.]
MKKNVGERVSNIRLTALDGTRFDLFSLKGQPYMLSFFRFASCPFCNLRMHELVSRFGELGGRFTIVAIFDSTLDNLREHADRHQSPFPVLADGRGVYYAQYGIEHSIFGVLKGMVFRMPSMLYAMFGKGYWPLKIKGSMTTMPADFLVDASGVIRVAHYGKDEGDHLPFDVVKQFATQQ